MPTDLLTDEQIDALAPDERRDLIRRLSRPAAEVIPSSSALRRSRALPVIVTGGGVLVLIPWIAYLAVELPRQYVVTHWDGVWVGFDVVLVVMLGLTFWLGTRRRQAVVLIGFATGVLIACDAWFDVMTASPDDVATSLAMAVLVELPVAYLLTSLTIRRMSQGASQLWLVEPGTSFWRIPLFALHEGDLGAR